MADAGYVLHVDIGDAHFEQPLRYFLTMKLSGGPGKETDVRTDVQPTPTTTPIFKTRSFTFSVPPDAEPGQWSLQVSAVAAVADGSSGMDDVSGAKAAIRVAGEHTLVLGSELLESGEIERHVSLLPPADAPGELPSAGGGAGGATVGTVQVKLRLTPGSDDNAVATGSAPVGSVAAGRSQPARSGAAGRGVAAASTSRFAASSGDQCKNCEGKSREVAHQQALIERLMGDLEQKTATVAKAGEEVMELRGVNKRLQTDLGALRAHVDERERAMEQLAGDATNVENIDMPQLQSRHRMLGAAYRSDRRRMEQLTAQVGQLTAALGTQEQLSASYARLKEAHREQAGQMQRLQEEAKKVAKYRQTCKQQEAIIQRLEALMAAALKDAKRVKIVEPQLEALRRQHAEVEAELAEQKAEYAKLEEEARQRERQLQQAIEEGRVAEDIEPISKGPLKEGEEEEEEITRGPRVNAEEQVKLLMRAEKAERRMAALEEEMQEMARANGREVAMLKMKLAEAQAASKGGFGSAANFSLGELTPAGTMTGEPPPSDGLPPAPPKSGSSRRSTPPGHSRLPPVGVPPVGAPPAAPAQPIT
jgi:hypothetical protein